MSIRGTTARYFGQTETLLGEYVWLTKNFRDERFLPVGSLRPNSFGLFDMQGNVMEWCQERIFVYGKGAEIAEDKEFKDKTSNANSRVLRGGSFFVTANEVRSATRGTNYPPDRHNVSAGFRVARTYR